MAKNTPPATNRREAERQARAAAAARAVRQRRLLTAGGIIGVVVVVIGGIVFSGALTHPKSAKTTAAADSVVSQLTSIPATIYDAVKAGTVQSRPTALTGAPALTADGKPRVLYVGAEYCPFCAAQRWAVVAALSRFGTFSNLGQTTSSGEDVFPDTPTLSFHGSTYTSKYLSFTGVELQSNQREGNTYATLDTLSAADQKVLQQYDVKKYTGGSDGGIPFLDLGGASVLAGASYSPQLLAGYDQSQVAALLADASNPITKAVVGTANVLTAHLCSLTGGQPAKVCTSPGVTAAR